MIGIDEAAVRKIASGSPMETKVTVTNDKYLAPLHKAARVSSLSISARRGGVEGRMARFTLDQLQGRSPRPL